VAGIEGAGINPCAIPSLEKAPGIQALSKGFKAAGQSKPFGLYQDPTGTNPGVNAKHYGQK